MLHLQLVYFQRHYIHSLVMSQVIPGNLSSLLWCVFSKQQTNTLNCAEEKSHQNTKHKIHAHRVHVHFACVHIISLFGTHFGSARKKQHIGLLNALLIIIYSNPQRNVVELLRF